MNTAPQGPDWWSADDGHWSPPERHPNYRRRVNQYPTTTQLSRQQVQQARREGSRYGNGQGSPAAPGPHSNGQGVRNVGARADRGL